MDEALAGLDGVDSLDAVETLTAAGQVQRGVNLAQAELLKVACHWADLNAVLDGSGVVSLPGTERLVRLGGVGTPEVAEFASVELGAQLGMSGAGAAMVMADGLDLRHRLPLMWLLVCAGEVKVQVARQVAQRTRCLSTAAAAVVDAGVARYAPTLSWGRLQGVVDAAVAAADPARAEQDALEARDRQGVWVGRDTDHGYRKVFIRAAGPDVESFDAMIDEIAEALELLGDPDGLDVRRAKAIGIVASTQATLELFTLASAVRDQGDRDDGDRDQGDRDDVDPGPAGARGGAQRKVATGDAVLYVHLAQEAVTGRFGVARAEGLGVLTIEQVREFLGHRRVSVRPVIDLNTMRAVDGYEIPPRLREAVHLVNPGDCSPYATNTDRAAGDIDHTTPYLLPDRGGPPGQTRLANLGRLLRSNHRWKTHGRWNVVQLVTGVWLWRSPHHFLYLVDGSGTTNLGRL